MLLAMLHSKFLQFPIHGATIKNTCIQNRLAPSVDHYHIMTEQAYSITETHISLDFITQCGMYHMLILNNMVFLLNVFSTLSTQANE
jgi:hypothetical protein